MEESLSEILDNLLGMLLLEGSYDIEEKEDSFFVSIDTKDAGRLIGARGESLDALSLLVNLMLLRKTGATAAEEDQRKRVIIDVEGWRKQKEDDLAKSAKAWAEEVLKTKKEMELEPMSPWQRRIVHMVISETEGLLSDSVGEGRDRHIVITLKDQNEKPKSEEANAENQKA